MPAISPTHKVFCANLLAARKERGLTQVQMAKLLRMTQPAYAALEMGRFMPRLATIERVARVLDCAPSALLDEAGVLA